MAGREQSKAVTPPEGGSTTQSLPLPATTLRSLPKTWPTTPRLVEALGPALVTVSVHRTSSPSRAGEGAAPMPRATLARSSAAIVSSKLPLPEVPDSSVAVTTTG